MQEVASSPVCGASDLVSSTLSRLSDVGQQIAPAAHVKVASFVPPGAAIEDMYDVVPPTLAWAGTPLPDDVRSALKPLLQLQDRGCRQDPDMQAIYETLALHLGCSRHLRPPASQARCSDAQGYDPDVLYAWLTQAERDRAQELRGPRSPLRVPPYNVNKGFCESDIAAYPAHLLHHSWGVPQLRTAEDACSPGFTRRSRGRATDSVHAKGGLTWMQRALEQPASFESAASYYAYREELLRVLGAAEAITSRSEVVSYSTAAAPPHATVASRYADEVLHRALRPH